MENLRKISLDTVRALNYPINQNLPNIDTPQNIRGMFEVADRLLSLHAVVATSYGFSKSKALDWLERENLIDSLGVEEKEFLSIQTNEAQNNAMQWQVEALWVLAWAVGCHSTLDFSQGCANNFVLMLPDLKKFASTSSFLQNLSMRTKEQILQQCDLAYCLHWGAREAALSGTVIEGAIPETAIRERRRALEWLVGDDGWYAVNLDT